MPLLTERAQRPHAAPEYHAALRDDRRRRAVDTRWRFARWIYRRAADAHEHRRLYAVLVRLRRDDPLEALAWRELLDRPYQPYHHRRI